jgi:hypothetical protein
VPADKTLRIGNYFSSHPIVEGQQNAALVPILILQAGKGIDYPFRVSQLVLKFLEKIMLKLDFIVWELRQPLYNRWLLARPVHKRLRQV